MTINMKMRNIFYLLPVIISIAGCSIDNYEAPSVTLTGKVNDNVTNEYDREWWRQWWQLLFRYLKRNQNSRY